MPQGRRADLWLFSESASRALVSCDPAELQPLLQRASDLGVPAARIGTTGGERIRVPEVFDVPVEEARAAWADALPERLDA